MRIYTLFILSFLLITSCVVQEEPKLGPADDRAKEAIEELKDELTSAPAGWKLAYRPTSESGAYFMLLDFNEDGTVNIKSDLSANEGEFYDRTIYYRIDAALGLELVFETYGVFHYLFELQQASFGAEFEFLFLEQDGNNLIFQSLSDSGFPTIIELERASPSDTDKLSYDLSSNLELYDSLAPQIFGGIPPIQQVVLESSGISIFWGIDLAQRILYIDMAGVGTTIEEISTNNVIIDRQVGYTLLEGNIVLDEPVSFTIGGVAITLSQISLSQFTNEQQVYCAGTPINSPVYSGTISGLGSVSVHKSLFDSDGLDFQPMAEIPYSVNVLFVFDGDANSLFQGGVIEEEFPTATGFVFNYGLESETQPANALGFSLDDTSSGGSKTYLRTFDVVERVGNKMSLALTDSIYYDIEPTTEEEQAMYTITDSIFEGGDVYIFQLPLDGLTIFWLFNPCNGYELFLVQ